MSQVSFEYRAIDRAGKQVQGLVSASARQEAYRRLAAQGLTPTRLKQAKLKSRRKGRRKKIRPEEIANVTYQLSVLLSARIPVVECFRSVAEQEQNEALARIMLDIAARVQSGNTITSSLEPHHRLFGTVYIETIRAAEQSGNMIQVLQHLAENVESQTEMTRLVRGALMYPLSVVCALTVAVLFLVTFVVPKFANMFLSRGVELPLLTRVLMLVGESIKGYWWAYLIVIAITIIAGRSMWHRPQARQTIDRYLHRIPYLRDVLTGLAVSRFAGIFGLSLRSGLGLIDSLEMSGRATGRPLLMRDTNTMIQQVRQGGRLGDVLQMCDYMPGFVKQLFRAGEQAAELPRMCEIIARHYDRETKHKTKNAATVIEPILIACLTGAVLVVALAIFLPMWDMVSLVS